MTAKDTNYRSAGGASAGGKMVVKVRWLKPYEGAQNHICIGEVLAETPQCLKVLGRTYHFRKPQGNIRAVQTSATNSSSAVSAWMRPVFVAISSSNRRS